MSQTIVRAPAAARSRPVDASRNWVGFLSAGMALACTASLISGSTEIVLWVLLQTLTTATVLFGVHRYGLERQRAWQLVIAAMIIAWIATLLWAVGWHALQIDVFFGLYQSGALAGYLCGVAALGVLGRGTDRTRYAGLLDAAIITLGLAIPYWAFIIDPLIDAGSVTGIDLVLMMPVPVLDMILLFMMAKLLISRRSRPWVILMFLGHSALLMADMMYLVDRAGGREFGTLSALGWMAWCVFVGTALLHPSVAETAERPGDGESTGPADTGPGRLRLWLFLGTVLLSPVLTTLVRSYWSTDQVVRPYDQVLVVTLTAALAGLLVLRLHNVARLAQARAATLDRQAAELTAQATELSDSLSRQKRLQHQLSHRALHDPLTGLGNRALLSAALETALAGRTANAALLLLDLDQFKDVNDTFGHSTGDELLVLVAQRLTGLLPTGGTLARLGGDEFAIVLPGADGRAATVLADQILESVRIPFQLGDRELHLSTSIGLLADTPVTGPSEALRDADLALYEAKRAGKDQIVTFEAALRKARLERTHITTGLRRAVAGAEFTMNYQPVMDLRTGEVEALEALLRWTPPGERPVPPESFVPMAEESGLIVPIGNWALDRACMEAGAIFKEFGVAFTVNVSGRQLRDDGFGALVLDTLRRHDLPERALILEVTESMLLTGTETEADRVIKILADLRAHGVRIALDDFGTGYSSLAYLRTLPVDILKIDRSFTAHVGGDGHDQTRAFTKAILELAASLDLLTVVEGVESPEQASFLKALGCPLAQGYLFSPPVTAAELPALLTAVRKQPAF